MKLCESCGRIVWGNHTCPSPEMVNEPLGIEAIKDANIAQSDAEKRKEAKAKKNKKEK